jgi:hypothetical protein
MMSVESTIFDTLKTLVVNRVYPDIGPETPTLPYITYQQVGGVGVNFVDPTVPSKKNSRFQVNVWAATRSAASTLAAQVEDALRTNATLQTSVLGAPVSIYEPDTKLRGTRQDFSFWM